VYNIIVDVNLALIDNRLAADQIPKNISSERLNDGSLLVLPMATARHVSDGEAYRTHSMVMDLNVK
jgi:hypothetical protein